MLECSQGKKNPPFMRFMNKEVSEIKSQSTTLYKNMDSNYNQHGLPTPDAKLMKVPANYACCVPRWMPIMAKCAISSNIADPIDREKECRCAAIDCQAGIFHNLTEMLRPLVANPDMVHRNIDAAAECQKQIVAEQAEAYRERQRRANWRAF